MKNILLIAILFLTSLVAKAEDYYDIPAGWEKVVEFDSKLQNLHLVASNKLIYLGYQNIYSTNGGVSFDSLKFLGDISGSKAFFIEDDLFVPTYIKYSPVLCKANLSNKNFDTVLNKSKSIHYVWGNYDKILADKDNSFIILSYYDGQAIIFSNDKGNSWEGKTFPKYNCNQRGDNEYNFIIDCTNPNRWILIDDFVSDWCQNSTYLITEDNGINYRKIEVPRINLISNYQERYPSPSFGFTDKYFGFDNSNSAISINYTRIPKQGNVVRYFNNGFKFIDIYDSTKDRSFNMDSLIASYLKVDSVYEGSVTIDKDYYLTKDNKILFMSYDKLPSKSKDTIFRKIFLFDYKTKQLEQLMNRKIPLIKDANFYSNSILHFDYNGGYVYYDLTAPQKSNELQKKIIIRRKIQDATSIVTESEKLESICLQDGKIVFEKEYQNPTIEIIDMVGKTLDYKILSTNPLTIEPNPNRTKGAYFLKIKDNQIEKNYKFIFE